MTDLTLEDDYLIQIEELKKEFLNGLRYDFEEWEAAVVQLDKLVKKDDTLLDLVRKVHNLKGTAGSYNIGIITTICHKFEETLEKLIRSKPDSYQNVIDQCLGYVDNLKEILSIELSIENPIEREVKYQKIWQSFDATPTLQSKKVLMVSGSKLVLNFINHTKFENEGVVLKIDFFKDGYMALGEALKYPYDVVIVDNQLDGLNGIPLISTIKMAGKQKTAYCILMTSDNIDQSEIPEHLQPDLCLSKDKSSLEKLIATLASI